MSQVEHYHGGHPAGGKRWNRGQVIKWTVYSLLLLNFFYYSWEEAYIAAHVLEDDATLIEWLREFATTIDELGWFGLLFAFELETYSLSDEAFKRRKVKWAIHGVRMVCYVMLAHTVFARVATVQEYRHMEQATGITDVCQLADEGVSFEYGYRYTEITTDNCHNLSHDDTFFYTGSNVVTDRAGFEHYRNLIYVDLNDAIMWLLVVWAIELAVWLQTRDITGGRLMLVTHGAKVFYGFLWAHAIWWAWNGHWVWAWDETLWISGFWLIEKNLSEWRDEIRDEEWEHVEDAEAAA